MTPVADQIRVLAGLEPDWDSYGGLPPTPYALSTAGLYADAVGGRMDLTPINDGGIEIEWATGVVIVVAPDGSSAPLSQSN